MIFNSKQTIEGNITIKESNGSDVVIAYCNATVNENKTGYNLMVQIVNVEKFEQYSEEVKVQHSKFIELINLKLKELNYNLD